jgi:HMG (high mobility group) box
MSNKSIDNLIQSMTSLFISTIQKQPTNKGKISLDEIIASVNSEDIQDQLKSAISENIKSSPKEKSSKLKDENAPKRPKSAYLFFAEKKRAEIKEENPDLKMTEISKVIGERWKEASPDSKAKYSKKAEKDKERYKEEMSEYVRPSDEVLLDQKINKKKGSKKSSGDKKRKKKEEGAPKGAKSAYMFFCSAKRGDVKLEHPEFTTPEVTRELARMWKEDFSTEEDRKEYTDQAAEDKERFIQEKSEWEVKNGGATKPKKGSSSKEAKASSGKAKASSCKAKASSGKAKAASSKDLSGSDSDSSVSAKTPVKHRQSAKAAVSSSDEDEDEPVKAKKSPKKAEKSPKPAQAKSKTLVKIPSFIGDDEETSSDDE